MQLKIEQMNGKVNFHSDQDNIVIRADQLEFSGVIQNLIDNALKYSQPNPVIEIELAQLSDCVQITIADNGVGIRTNNGKIKSKKSSLATAITEERLTLLSKDFMGQGALKIEDRKEFGERGTKVTLVIPYKTEVQQIEKIDSKVVITCRTKGVTIGYRMKNTKIWTIYSEPFLLPKGEKIEVIADRIGFLKSEIVVF